jgi:hypothetical protein
MNLITKVTFLLSLSFSSVFAGTPNIDLLTQEQADSISKEFSSNFVHTIVAPASSLGDIFGFEVGVIGGITKTPAVDRLSKSFDANATIDKIPHAGLIGSVSLPFGFTTELGVIPEVGSDIKIEHKSYALKWTFSQFIKMPFDLAIRVHGSNSKLSYSDVISNVNTTVSYDMSSLGAHLTLSKKFLFIEPYAGVGTVSTDTDISTAGTTTVSLFSFSASEKYSSSNSGTHLFLGANVNLLLFKVGLEHSKIVDVNRTTAKLSFYF